MEKIDNPEDENLAKVAAARLAEVRRRLGLSQRRIAQLMGTRQSAISEMENGITQANVLTLELFAGCLGMQMSIVFEPVAETPPSCSARVIVKHPETP